MGHFVSNIKCYFESPETKIPADPDIDGWGVICAFFVTALCSMFLVITAFILQRASNPINFIFPDNAWKAWREKKYPKIQKILSALADQQLISGMGILIAGIIRSQKMSYFHLTQVGNLAGLSNLAIIYSLEYENLELAPLGSTGGPNLRTKSPINIVCTSLAVVYLILLISFNV
ncbi:10271_t:CDS:1, partial [Acaulospora colombiana]